MDLIDSRRRHARVVSVGNLQERLLAFMVVAGMVLWPALTIADESVKGIKAEFLMTLYAPLDAPENIDESLSIANVGSKGGWPEAHGLRLPYSPWRGLVTDAAFRRLAPGCAADD